MKCLEELRVDYMKMPIHCLQKIANNEYDIDNKTIKIHDTKSLIDYMIAIEFKNYYK